MERPQILWVSHSFTKPLEGVKNHTHPYYHMFYMVAGKLRFEIENKTYILSSGNTLLVPRNVNHAFYNDEKETAEHLEIKFSLFKSAFDKQISAKDIQISDNKLAGMLFEQIIKEYSTRLNPANDAATSYLLSILNVLNENERYKNKEEFRFFAGSRYSELSQKVIRYLENHYNEEVSLDELAKNLNRNKSHLCVAFKKDTLLTIFDCLNMIRVRRAAELIVYGEDNLTQVANKCGFASVSHFNRVFLKYVGITPGQCRRAYPADALIRQESNDTSSIRNDFMYSVLAQKLITPSKD